MEINYSSLFYCDVYPNEIIKSKKLGSNSLVIDWIEGDLNASLQSIVRKGRVGLNYWGKKLHGHNGINESHLENMYDEFPFHAQLKSS